jgi:hypothetical protein
MNLRTVFGAGLAAALAVTITACGSSPTGPGNGNNNGGGSTATVTNVTIGGATSVTEGGTAQLTATANRSNGTTETVTSQATWNSSNTMVATVSATGLLTALAPGSTDISAAFGGQTGRRTLQVAVARFGLVLAIQSVTALNTCDDFTQGLTNGEFATRVQWVTPNGGTEILDQTTAYPGDPDNLRVYNLGQGESQSINETRTFTLDGEAGQFVRVQFNATEWDSQIVIIPPSTRWVRDGDMNDRSTTRTHSFSNGNFGSLGPNSLTLGASGCQIRLSYNLSSTRQ